MFVLGQALRLYDAYSAQIVACDRELEQYLKQMESRSGDPQAPLPDLPPAKRDSHSKNAPTFNARAQYARLLGLDDDHQRDWHGHESLADGQALQRVAGAGAAE